MANRPVYHQYTAQSRLKPDRIYLELVFRVHGPNPIKFGSAIALSSGHMQVLAQPCALANALAAAFQRAASAASGMRAQWNHLRWSTP